jgi:hypothetical protein
MTPRLSPHTAQLVEAVFKARDVAEASHWLEEECGNNLPSCRDLDEYRLERIRFAAIKLSQGNLHKLLHAIDEARMDWRDLLMAAGFGERVDTHEAWAKEVLKEP